MKLYYQRRGTMCGYQVYEAWFVADGNTYYVRNGEWMPLDDVLAYARQNDLRAVRVGGF